MIRFDYPVKVYYKDVDQMGIVYYSRYFEYFEAARTELFNSIGLDVTTIENQGIYLPVITSHCDYKKGAKFDQEIIVETSISELPKARLKIEYFIHPKIREQTLVTGYTTHAFMKKSGRPTKVPEIILKTLKEKMEII
ncbi:MAG: acyl-CoA thioesterase [Fidelibacterota bacterium]